MKIHRLTSEVIDQIAAGEVLERPANLVKELIENSLDAGSTEIEVSIEHGGRQISIKDNGHGIARESLPLVFERHATSKIQDFSDLWKLQSFGFRGEALASVTSVSRTQLTTRISQDAKAYSVSSEFGKLSEIAETRAEVGTTIEVTNLFENVPARLKFLKSDAAEVTAIKRLLKAITLSYPECAFWVRIEGELWAYWPKTNEAAKRVHEVLKRDFYFAEASAPGFKASMYFTSPNDVERTSQYQWFFVNRRWVQERSLQSAVIEAYRHLLMHGEYPSCVVLLEVSPELVDVNVHPTKSQVRFADPKQAFRLVHYGIKNHLEKAPWMQNTSLDRGPDIGTSIDLLPPAEPSNLAFQDAKTVSTQFKQKPSFSDFSNASSRFIEEPQPPTLSDLEKARVSRENFASAQPLWRNLHVIGQANMTYILAQSSRGLMVIDQHAAHERVNFERLMKSRREGEAVETQRLLMPLSLTFESDEVEAILKSQAELQRIGIEVEQGGPEAILISTVPSLLKEDAIQRGLKILASEILDLGESFAFERQLGDIFATFACHSSIRAGQALSFEEMSALLAQMDDFTLSTFCPHGRPVFIEYPFRELESDFGRIV